MCRRNGVIFPSLCCQVHSFFSSFRSTVLRFRMFILWIWSVQGDWCGRTFDNCSGWAKLSCIQCILTWFVNSVSFTWSNLLFSYQELKGVLCYVPEIVDMVGSAYANQILHINKQDGEEKVKSILQSIFTKLMLASKEMIMKVLSNIKSRLQIESQVSCN